MYNEELNNQWINRLKGHVRGKKVLLLGNSLSLFSEKTGDFIDSFDVVIRVGKGLPYPYFTEYIGKKFDVWSFGVLRAPIIEHVTAPFKIYNFLQVHVYDKKNLFVNPSFMYNERFQIYRDYFLIGPLLNIKSYFKLFPKSTDIRLSQGLITLLFILDKLKNIYDSVHLYGFDFFRQAVSYQQQDETKVAYSWHIPKTKKGLLNPHSYDLEKRFIERMDQKGIVTLHPCPCGEIDKYVLESLFSKFRPEANKE